MPTEGSWGSILCIFARSGKGRNNPSMIPSNLQVGEKENLQEPQTSERTDQDDATFEGRSNYQRSKNSNRNPKKVKLNVDVNINLGKH